MYASDLFDAILACQLKLKFGSVFLFWPIYFGHLHGISPCFTLCSGPALSCPLQSSKLQIARVLVLLQQTLVGPTDGAGGGGLWSRDSAESG